MVTQLFGSETGTIGGAGTGLNQNEWSTDFSLSSPQYLRNLRWYRDRTGSTHKPSILRVWDTSNSSVAFTCPAVPDDGTVGWQLYTLTSQVILAQGVEYRASICMAQGASFGRIDADPQNAPSPFTWAAAEAKCTSTLGGACGYPNTTPTDTSWFPCVDVGVDPNPPATPTATLSDIQQAVTDIDAHTDAKIAIVLSMVSDESTPSAYSIPNKILTSVGADLAGDVAAVKTVVDGIATDVGDILTSVGAALATAVSTVQDTLSHASTGMVDVLNGVSSTVDDILNSASTGLVKVLNYLGGGGGALPPRSSVPATGWANVATTAFTDDIAWTQPADMYVVTFSDVGANDTTTLISGLDIVYRLAWWLPLNATQLQGERRFIDAPLVELTDGGKRMPGLALHCPKGGAGTIDAWQYTP